ncbi:hypothetical protein ACQJBY_051787 [Aegilops geniculata]
MATQSYRKNFITSLQDEDGTPFQNHDHKAAIIWKSYKDRLGKAINPPMLFNLEELIQPKDLSELEAPFTMDEIDQVIKYIHSDRAPGPDGFNGLFLKKCWDIIKQDIYTMIWDLFEGNIDIQSINTAFITLIPKITNPIGMNDFRPISLYIINAAWANGEITLPTNQAYGLDYPIIQYADDTLLIMPADEEQLSHLKYLLNLFSMSTGLFVNYNKSSMIPINMDQQSINNLARSFGCKVESLPFTYLGLPMGTTKPSVHDLIPVISRIDKRLSGVARFMNHSGRLTYVNSVVASMPIFAMCSLKVHVTILDHVDKSSRNFLWYGNEINNGGKCLASWEMICKPKQQGGLGVLNLREQNKALLIKHLFKFYNEVDVPWGNDYL